MAEYPAINAWQKVWVNGVQAQARDCRIRRTHEQRITEFDLVIERGMDGYDQVQIGAALEIQHGTGETADLTEKGEITAFDQIRMSANHASIRVRGKGEAVKLTRHRILEHWEDTSPVDIIIETLAQVTGISAGTLEDPGENIVELDSAYDSAFDIIEKIARQTAYAWRVKDGQLDFFDPEAVIGPAITMGRIVADTLQYSKSAEQVQNIALVQAYEYKKQNIAAYQAQKKQIIDYDGEPAKETAIWGECLTAFTDGNIPGSDSDWEVCSNPYIYRPERYYKGKDPEEWIKGTVNQDEQRVKLDPQIKVETGEDVQVRYNLRRPLWVERKHSGSIAKFGIRYGQPISDDGGMDIEAATALADETLERRAWATIEASLDVLDIDHDIDQISQLNHADLALDKILYVRGLDRVWTDGRLNIRLELSCPDTNPVIRGNTSKVDPIMESVKRIERLERQSGHGSGLRGRVTSQIGTVAGTEALSSEWGWESEIDYFDVFFGDLGATLPMQIFQAEVSAVAQIATQIPMQQFVAAAEFDLAGFAASIATEIPMQQATLSAELTAQDAAISIHIPMQQESMLADMTTFEGTLTAQVPMQEFEAGATTGTTFALSLSVTIPMQTATAIAELGAYEAALTVQVPMQQVASAADVHQANADMAMSIPMQTEGATGTSGAYVITGYVNSDYVGYEE